MPRSPKYTGKDRRINPTRRKRAASTIEPGILTMNKKSFDELEEPNQDV